VLLLLVLDLMVCFLWAGWLGWVVELDWFWGIGCGDVECLPGSLLDGLVKLGFSRYWVRVILLFSFLSVSAYFVFFGCARIGVRSGWGVFWIW